MTDKELIESLRNYAKSYISDKPYSFNPGTAILVAERMSEFIKLIDNKHKKIEIQTKFNIGDRVWIPDDYMDGDYVVVNKDGYRIINIEITISQSGQRTLYTIKADDGSVLHYLPELCFGSYEECQAWCNDNNMK